MPTSKERKNPVVVSSLKARLAKNQDIGYWAVVPWEYYSKRDEMEVAEAHVIAAPKTATTDLTYLTQLRDSIIDDFKPTVSSEFSQSADFFTIGVVNFYEILKSVREKCIKTTEIFDPEYFNRPKKTVEKEVSDKEKYRVTRNTYFGLFPDPKIAEIFHQYMIKRIAGRCETHKDFSSIWLSASYFSPWQLDSRIKMDYIEKPQKLKHLLDGLR